MERKGKLSPRFVGPFEILKRVGKVAYELALTSELTSYSQCVSCINAKEVPL